MPILKIAMWCAFASACACIYWALTQRSDADLIIGLTGALTAFLVGAVIAGIDGIIVRLDAVIGSSEQSAKQNPGESRQPSSEGGSVLRRAMKAIAEN